MIVALVHHGHFGICALHFQTWGGAQVLTDLTIALVLIMVWMRHDAKPSGRYAWPWFLAMLALGAFGRLVYLLTRPQP